MFLEDFLNIFLNVLMVNNTFSLTGVKLPKEKKNMQFKKYCLFTSGYLKKKKKVILNRKKVLQAAAVG